MTAPALLVAALLASVAPPPSADAPPQSTGNATLGAPTAIRGPRAKPSATTTTAPKAATTNEYETPTW